MWGVDIVIDFIDRVSSGKKLIKYENGITETVTIENAEDETVEGTPINRDNMMAIQGFQSNTIRFNDDGSIVETNSEGHTLTTTFQEDGSIKEEFEGTKNITKIIKFNSDGSILEVVE